MKIQLPLMENNITAEDRQALIDFLQEDRILTQNENVRKFEAEWCRWLGVKHGVFVNSGSSANLLTLSALRHLRGGGEIIVPPLTWVSDIAAVLQNGFTPVFADIDPRHLGMNEDEILKKVGPKTRAVFLTHILGFNALSRKLLDGLSEKGIPLIEDVCESHGATFRGKKLGTYGFASNFSFYYAHHMSTIEGGIVCTDDEEFYETVRMLRAHGMVRESDSPAQKEKYRREFPDLNPDFIFAYPAYNMRSTELNAVLGLSQLKRLDANNEKRRRNFDLFLGNLDSSAYRTDFALEGSVNYAFTLILRNPDDRLRDGVEAALRAAGVEFRRGTSGGGNQLRQPYLRRLLPEGEHLKLPQTEHVHFYGYYIGNYPDLPESKIMDLCQLLNEVARP